MIDRTALFFSYNAKRRARGLYASASGALYQKRYICILLIDKNNPK